MHIFLRYANSFNSFYLFIMKFVQLGTQIKTQCKKEENIQKYAMSYETSYRPGGGETICPPPGRWQLDSRRIYVRPPTGPQSANLWCPAVAIA